jgi:putative transposase
MVMEFPQRKHPVHGVHECDDRTTVVLLTVCTRDRQSWLAEQRIHEILRKVWEEATGWLVGLYVLMPDHLHLFATPGDLDCSLGRWVGYWKHRFSILVDDPVLRLQADHWDTRIRNGQHFAEKWEYILHNPVRKGLVSTPEEWPYHGIIHEWNYTGP